jgi:hypothetical protein
VGYGQKASVQGYAAQMAQLFGLTRTT